MLALFCAVPLLPACTNDRATTDNDFSQPQACEQADPRKLYWRAVELLKVNKDSPQSPDAKEGIRLLECSAGRGDSAAQNLLGMSFFVGDFFPKNNDQAVEWLVRASTQGEYASIMMLFSIYLTEVTNTKIDEYFSIVQSEAKKNNFAARYVDAASYCLGLYHFPYDVKRCNAMMDDIKGSIDDRRRVRLAEAMKLSGVNQSIAWYGRRHPRESTRK